jgi:hypothetical protein
MPSVVLLFWTIAAALVAACHFGIETRWPAAGAAGAIVSVAAAAYAYMRLHARDRGTSHALGVGVAWLGLAIVAEVTISMRLGHGWYALLGSPAHPLLRNAFLFVWVFAPAAFASRGLES